MLQSVEYYDVHAIAGLLKTFLRELPTHILTRELQPEFLAVIDLPSRPERLNALTDLIARLPIEEYTLLRFLSVFVASLGAPSVKLTSRGVTALRICASLPRIRT